MGMAIAMFIIIFVICLLISFCAAMILTWAICFVASLFGIALAFSWKLVIAIWIIAGVFTSAKTIYVKKG